MDLYEKDGSLALLKQKVGGMEEKNDLKYASAKELSDIKTQIKLCEHKVENLGKRFDDHIGSQRYMTATVISIASLIIATIVSIINLTSKIFH